MVNILLGIGPDGKIHLRVGQVSSHVALAEHFGRLTDRLPRNMHPSDHGKYRRALAGNANDRIEIRFLEDAKIKKIARREAVVTFALARTAAEG